MKLRHGWLLFLATLLTGSLLVGCCVLLDAGEDPLVETGCAPRCQAGEVCHAGKCLPLDCSDKDCGNGALCENGECVTEACVGVSCVAGQGCEGGRCLPLSCSGVPCGEGELCLDGACQDFRCAGVTCPKGQFCQAGACQGCVERETQCANGIDEDCDGAEDCADVDCAAQPCTDGKLCTVGETCSPNRTCTGGAATTCDVPEVESGCWKTPGTCNEGTGCLYEPEPEGVRCDDGDPCTEGETCDGSGGCHGRAKVCNAPPKTGCFLAEGKCSPVDGECDYTPKLAEARCADNPCLQGQVCDGNGNCTGGTPVNDGAKCGTAPGERCCTGRCVDISRDPENCGGCGRGCFDGRSCLPITSTPCSAPAGAISGRCSCQNNTSECKVDGFDQQCRVGNEANVCVPGECSPDQTLIIPNNDLNRCAPYCRYP